MSNLLWEVCILVFLSLRQHPAETRPLVLVFSVSSVLTIVVKAVQVLVRFPFCLSVKPPVLCLFWASRSATSARQQVLWGPNDCLFQMVIRAAPLCPGLFLIEAQRSRAQLGADQLALPTYLPESCWRHLFDHHPSRHRQHYFCFAPLPPCRCH